MWRSPSFWNEFFTLMANETTFFPKQFPDLTDQQKAEARGFLQTLDDHDDVHRVRAALKQALVFAPLGAGSPQILADFPEQFCNSTVKAVLNPE